ncbi:EbsA family protein [Atopococcus tabaci]|uniref:EbsA family protein n=1 Tax=Atopococcus tabaci TaxID=269774 RepID=UPI00048016E8|nr:EbsA family protein [Atopococcus tabaci]
MKRLIHKQDRSMRLSMDTPSLVIYWSLTALAFFSGVISALEIQRVNLLTVSLGIFVLMMVLVARSSFLYFLEDCLVFSYLFGLKKAKVFFSDIHQAVITNHKQVELVDKQNDLLKKYHLSKKNSDVFCSQLKKQTSSVIITKRRNNELTSINK